MFWAHLQFHKSINQKPLYFSKLSVIHASFLAREIFSQFLKKVLQFVSGCDIIIIETKYIDRNGRKGVLLMKNTNLYNRQTRYEIVAGNGQVLEHGFTSQRKCLEQIKRYKQIHQYEKFYMNGYDLGKYGGEI